jgi:hypothetical protein
MSSLFRDPVSLVIAIALVPGVVLVVLSVAKRLRGKDPDPPGKFLVYLPIFLLFGSLILLIAGLAFLNQDPAAGLPAGPGRVRFPVRNYGNWFWAFLGGLILLGFGGYTVWYGIDHFEPDPGWELILMLAGGPACLAGGFLVCALGIKLRRWPYLSLVVDSTTRQLLRMKGRQIVAHCGFDQVGAFRTVRTEWTSAGRQAGAYTHMDKHEKFTLYAEGLGEEMLLESISDKHVAAFQARLEKLLGRG